MTVSGRVASEKDEVYLDFVSGSYIPKGRTRSNNFIIVKRGKMYRVHEDGSSSAPGPTAKQVVVGAIVRRYDPEAGELEGKPAKFATPDEAVKYVKRWL